MKIMIIRHAEPNYEIDGLTEKGAREAKLLVPRLTRENIGAIYCSTLGRARRTIEPTLNALGLCASYCEWLREFGYASVKLPYAEKRKNAWDILPSYMNENAGLYERDAWQSAQLIKDSDVSEAYRAVIAEFDSCLRNHGYDRAGDIYRVRKASHDTLIFVCHFGVGSILLSHLMNCSPYSLWQHTVLLPSSVSTFVSEERREGIAHFRATAIGDLSHLYAANEEPSFAARFCEVFSDDTRHD